MVAGRGTFRVIEWGRRPPVLLERGGPLEEEGFEEDGDS